ncbi:replication-associated recombination protein A [Agrobacterium rubi]|nr:replication-associated recombination protein A [Agrobacterium rubi]NTF24041.1 replication-associated recombination protein A [Agrobacterium rubi]
MSDLFTAARSTKQKPLAEEVRPSTLQEIIGQQHILGPGMQLARRVASGRLGSSILYGPPGTGKTTIARAIGKSMKSEFVALHPAEHGAADIRKVADRARHYPTLCFVDECHRYSAATLDLLLGFTEDGAFDFIGATSENPYHNLTKALVSRSTIYELHPLSVEEIRKTVLRAAAHIMKGGMKISFEEDALDLLAKKSGGDARRALGALENISSGRDDGFLEITVSMVEESLAASPVTFDRKGDAHYDIISAFVKSMRGGDEDATLLWLAALVHAGEDPRYIARRMMVHASEDVGLADPTALQSAVSAMLAVEKIGYPEARIVLAQAALHICRAPKSNSAFRGINLASAYIQSNNIPQVPAHLRDTHYEGAAPMGRGGYRSPHSSDSGWVEQSYAPPEITPGIFYQSDARTNNTFEQRADSFWEKLRNRPAIKAIFKRR